MTKPTLAILNITSYSGQCSDAEHLYGRLIICEQPDITIDNVTEWSVRYLGESVEVFRDVSYEEACQLDEKDGTVVYTHLWKDGDKRTSRFNTFDEVVTAGIEKWKELKLDCPFISLYEGDKYYVNDYGSDATVIQYPEK